MSERIGHAAVAEGILSAGQEVIGKIRDAHALGDRRAADDYGKKAMGCWAQAQVHATLALVEQQRLANILALVGDEDPETVDDNLREFGVDPVAVRADIRAALGWS